MAIANPETGAIKCNFFVIAYSPCLTATMQSLGMVASSRLQLVLNLLHWLSKRVHVGNVAVAVP